jgi:transposase InsO family protein
MPVTGDSLTAGREKRKHLRQDYAHAAIDDHSRPALSELYPDERAGSALTFIEHALAFYRSHGITVNRVLTDNAWLHPRSRSRRAARPRRHPAQDDSPSPSQTNGRIERFHQTMARE